MAKLRSYLKDFQKSFHLSRFLFKKIKLFSVLLFFFIMACNDEKTSLNANSPNDTIPSHVEITAANLAGSFSTQSILKVDSPVLDSFFIKYPSLSPFENNMRNFYTGRHFAFAWYDSSGLIEQAGNLHNRFQNLQEEGVSGNVPSIRNLDSLMASPDTKDETVRSETEILLTGLYFYFAEKVWGGLDEKKTKQIDWFLPRKKVDYELWLDSLLQIPDGFAKEDEPVYRQYHLLKSFLKKYRDLDAQNKWEPLKAEKKSYRPGDSADFLIDVKRRLYLLGDMQAISENQQFDSILEEATKKFQRRFGMKQDGIIGQQMIRELNQSLKKRIEQITVNMERSRWLPDAIKGDYLAVNIPEFKLHAYKDDSLIWDMNVVVGKSLNKTVIFSGNLKHVVFSPYWNVPPGILKNEVLPGIRRNKNYLATHHMEWNGNNVRQKPGPWNSLGNVKFLFPNSFSIYLHDTPSKSLFKEDMRAFSHGCIRVEEPKKLALYLLRKDTDWNEKKVVEAMNRGKEQYVTLKEDVPVFIAYFTVWVDRQNQLNFREDIYKRDSRLAEMVVNK